MVLVLTGTTLNVMSLMAILMTSLATIIGLMPMALKLGEGSESYAPLARALIGGLLVSVAIHGVLSSGGLLARVSQLCSQVSATRMFMLRSAQ
jgi:Cu/Ag efflux pump CusA